MRLSGRQYRGDPPSGFPQFGQNRMRGDGTELVSDHVVQFPRQPGPFEILRVPGSCRGRIAVRTGNLSQSQSCRQKRTGNGRTVAALVRQYCC